MKRPIGCSVVLIACITAAMARADTPPVARAGLSQADTERLVELLSADDFEARQEALKKLQSAMGDNMRRLVVVQEAMIRLQQSLAAELKTLTMARDLEAVAHSATLMEFNEALSRWAAEVMQLPEAQRAEALKWGLSDEGMQVVARAYSPRSSIRVEGIRNMAKVPGSAVSALLAKMIDSPDRETAIAAMDGVWDRPPTPQALAALWEKAIGSMAAAYGNGRPERTHVINFHGRPVNIQVGNGSGNNEDYILAGDVLVHLQAPDTAARLKTFLAEFAHQPLDPNNGGNYRFQMLLPNYGGLGQNLQRLIDAFHPKEIVPVYMHFIIDQGTNDGNSGEQQMNGKKYRYGTKLDMIYRLCKSTDQDPDIYGITHTPQFGDRAVLEGGEKEEAAAMAKVKTWWNAHKAEYGEGPAKTQPATRSGT